jgi:UDP-N-acetylmuramyl pentapeptide phosphotransferase/UDP-N-acetylglucosamine-1-phosphate transferase
MMTTLAITAVAAMTCAVAGTGLLRTHAAAWGLIDVPNERSLHTRVMPRGGGIVLVLTVLGGLLVVGPSAAAPPNRLAAYAGAALLVAVIGWRDDYRSVPPAIRLVTHLVAAAIGLAAWGTFGRIQLPGIGEIPLPNVIAIAVTMVWLVGLLNAYNFMDGIDGMASGQAVVAGVMWALACGTAAPLPTATAALIAAASLGFLWHNWSPARIFMGDTGSGFLGFSFAILPLMAYQALGDPRLPVVGLLIVAPFVFDTMFTMTRRARRGEKLLDAHRSHLYQRLVTAGWSHSVVATLYLMLACLSGASALAWLRGGLPGQILLIPAAAILGLPVLAWVAERKRS